MGRPRNNKSEDLIFLVDDFFANEARGNPDKLKASLIAAYAEKKGIDVKAYNLRRDAGVRKRIEELKESIVSDRNPYAKIAYKTLDIEGMLRQCVSVSAMRKALSEMDEYWRSVYESSADIHSENARLYAERLRFKKKIDDLEKQISILKEENGNLKKEALLLKDEIKYLKKLLNKYVYPEVAKELLRQHKLPVKGKCTITDDAITELIASNQPESYSGQQKKSKASENRANKLISIMRKQVEE